MSGSPLSADLDAVLLDYEGPQLVQLSTGKLRRILGVAVPAHEGMENPFFGCAVRDKSYEKYFDGTADLNYVFRNALRNIFYFFDLVSTKGIKLIRADEKDIQNQSNWPDVGIFSRSHTSDFGLDRPAGSTQTYKIDGTWDTGDFAAFNNKVEDLYAYFLTINLYSDNNERAFLKGAIKDQLWRRGGSYGAFFSELKSRRSSLRIGRVQYGSPGEIDLKGDREALSDISDILSVFEEDHERLHELHNQLEALLKREKLLSAEPNTPLATGRVTKLLDTLAHDLASSLGLDQIGTLRELCDDNSLVFAKLVRSVYARARRLNQYQVEGRLQGVNLR